MAKSYARSLDSYDTRSLEHERRMLDTYRRESQKDASLLQPLANSCWRAACFEWALAQDAATVRDLWGEAARALAHGFARKGAGFDPSPDQFILALNLSIASREVEPFTTLAHFAPGVRANALRGAQAFRGARAHFHMAEGYALIARAILERRRSPAREAIKSLRAAAEESDHAYWIEKFPEPRQAAWLASEHEAIRSILTAVASAIVNSPPVLADEAPRLAIEERSTDDDPTALAAAIDEALLRLEQFVQFDPNHHPKLYVWLPGIAMCALASAAHLPVKWLEARHESNATGYTHLPLELLANIQQRD